MLQFTYTSEAWAALAKKPADRRPGISDLVQKAGGKFVDLYYHYGEYDGFSIVEAPDDIACTATTIAAVAAGHLKNVRTTRLMTVEETMQAMKKAGTMSYQAPRA
jgi:uncharacterized protein with GYD domain